MKRFLLFILLFSFVLLSANSSSTKYNSIQVAGMEQTNTKSKLYPNPASEFTIIQNSSSIKIKEIVILSMVGSSMFSKETAANNTEINVAKLPAGRYFVKISYADGSREILTLIKI